MPGLTPLATSHCETLDCVLRKIQETRTLIEQCDHCGLDVSAAKEELARQEQLATRLKSTFFPNNP